MQDIFPAELERQDGPENMSQEECVEEVKPMGRPKRRKLKTLDDFA